MHIYRNYRWFLITLLITPKWYFMNSEVVSLYIYSNMHFHKLYTYLDSSYQHSSCLNPFFLIKISQRLFGTLTRAKLDVQPCPLEYELCKRGCRGRAAKCSECSSNVWRFAPKPNQLQTQPDPEAANKY